MRIPHHGAPIPDPRPLPCPCLILRHVTLPALILPHRQPENPALLRTYFPHPILSFPDPVLVIPARDAPHFAHERVFILHLPATVTAVFVTEAVPRPFVDGALLEPEDVFVKADALVKAVIQVDGGEVRPAGVADGPVGVRVDAVQRGFEVMAAGRVVRLYVVFAVGGGRVGAEAFGQVEDVAGLFVAVVVVVFGFDKVGVGQNMEGVEY